MNSLIAYWTIKHLPSIDYSTNNQAIVSKHNLVNYIKHRLQSDHSMTYILRGLLYKTFTLRLETFRHLKLKLSILQTSNYFDMIRADFKDIAAQQPNNATLANEAIIATQQFQAIIHQLSTDTNHPARAIFLDGIDQLPHMTYDAYIRVMDYAFQLASKRFKSQLFNFVRSSSLLETALIVADILFQNQELEGFTERREELEEFIHHYNNVQQLSYNNINLYIKERHKRQIPNRIMPDERNTWSKHRNWD